MYTRKQDIILGAFTHTKIFPNFFLSEFYVLYNNSYEIYDENEHQVR